MNNFPGGKGKFSENGDADEFLKQDINVIICYVWRCLFSSSNKCSQSINNIFEYSLTFKQG